MSVRHTYLRLSFPASFRTATGWDENCEPGVNILQRKIYFVLGIFKVLQGRIPIKFDNLKKNN